VVAAAALFVEPLVELIVDKSVVDMSLLLHKFSVDNNHVEQLLVEVVVEDRFSVDNKCVEQLLVAVVVEHRFSVDNSCVEQRFVEI